MFICGSAKVCTVLTLSWPIGLRSYYFDLMVV